MGEPMQPNVEEIEVSGANACNEQLQRLLSDFVNYKRRVEKEREEYVKSANKELVLKLLPVIDDFGRALQNAPDNLADSEWTRGIAMVKRNLDSMLAEEGLSRIEAEGKEFDPAEHEAVFVQEGDENEQGRVKSVMRTGYRLHDQVIRPAQVAVIKGIKKPESPIQGSKRVPVRRGGNRGWERSRVAPGVRGTFF